MKSPNHAMHSGSPAELAVSHGPVPSCVSVTPDNRFLTVDGMAFTNFDFEIARDAPVGKLAPLPMVWTVREPEITGQLIFNIEVVADQVVLPLPQPLSQLSQENNAKPIICDRAVLTISNSGSWNLNAHFDNQETLADVNFVFEVTLSFVDAAGNRFGETIDGGLSAAGDGPATTIGLRALGYPPAGTYLRHGTFCAVSRSDVLAEREGFVGPVPHVSRIRGAGRREYPGSSRRSVRRAASSET
jgi:hypothetical protein